MSRLERLVNLTAALRSAPRPLTAEELHERVAGYPADKASFRRQFERDKDALRELGVPVQIVTDGPVAAYVVPPEEYELRDPGLEPDELDALHLAAQMVRIEGMAPAEGLWKLTADTGSATPARPERAKSGGTGEADRPLPATLPASEALASAFAGIAEGRAVSFTYRGQERLVAPLRLVFRTGHWYLSGFDHGRGASRSFRIDRIESVMTLGGPAELPEGVDAGDPAALTSSFDRPWELGDGPARRALVRIDAERAPWIVNHIGEAHVHDRSSDGSVTLALTVANVDAFRSFVLGFLDHAVVLDPPELRDEIVAWLRPLAGAQ